MAKPKLSLSERVAERARKVKKQARGGANRAEFLAVKDEVAKTIADGWPVKDVWATLRDEGAITFSYDAFIGYVRRLITTKADHSPRDRKGADPKPPVEPESLAAKAQPSPRPITTPVPKPNTETSFVFDPKPKRR